MATNTAGITAGYRLKEEALRIERLEPGLEQAANSAATAAGADAGQEFALLPLVDKIAYAFASGLIVAMRELEAHIAGETRKVSDSVHQHLAALEASIKEMTEALAEQRNVNAAVQEKCRELEAATVALGETDSRQDAELNAIRADAAALTGSVAERFEKADAAIQELDARQTGQVTAVRNQVQESSANLAERITATETALQETDARTAADVVALRAEVKELSASTSERVEALSKELMLHQEDLAALKSTLAGFSSAVDGFVERLDKQAEALRSMFAAYSQRETQLEQLVDGLTRLRPYPPPAAPQF